MALYILDFAQNRLSNPKIEKADQKVGNFPQPQWSQCQRESG